MHVSAPKLRSLSFVGLTALALAATGCDSGDSDGEQGQAAQQGDQPETAGPAPPKGAAPADDEGRESVDDAIGGEPSAPSGDPCEGAYSSMRSTADAMNKSGATKKKVAIPPKERFMAACAELPEQMQRCMGIRYHMAHQEKCKKAAEEVDPELKERVQELIGKRPSGATDPATPE